MGKKAHADPPVEMRINVPQSIAAKMELLLLDPLTRRPRYGARSDLITKLLREWISSKEKPSRKAQGDLNDRAT